MKKTAIGMFQAMNICSKYKKMNASEKNKCNDVKLRQMVSWAKENSPYYAAHYKNITNNYRLSDLPPVNKTDLMIH